MVDSRCYGNTEEQLTRDTGWWHYGVAACLTSATWLPDDAPTLQDNPLVTEGRVKAGMQVGFGEKV